MGKVLEHQGLIDLDATPFELDPDLLWLEDAWPNVPLRQLIGPYQRDLAQRRERPAILALLQH